MDKHHQQHAESLLGQAYDDLSHTEQKVIESIADNKIVVENVNTSFSEKLTLGQRVADRIATFGGSWTFIGIFFSFIATWIFINTYWLTSHEVFDPYPFILLNLGLSTLAAFQAPIIMMSQNRQVAKDRIEQKATYEINLKLELELMRVHEKLDDITKHIKSYDRAQ